MASGREVACCMTVQADNPPMRSHLAIEVAACRWWVAVTEAVPLIDQARCASARSCFRRGGTLGGRDVRARSVGVVNGGSV